MSVILYPMDEENDLQLHLASKRINDEITGLEMKREGSMHLVPAPAVRLMKSRVTSRPGNKVFSIVIFFLNYRLHQRYNSEE